MKNWIIIASTWLSIAPAWSQTDVDALRYSSRQYLGSARTAGIAGTTGATGADILNAAINPAGLAQYRSNEWTIGMNYRNARNGANFFNNGIEDFNPNLNIPAVGMVFTHLNYDPSGKLKKDGWINVNTAFSYNRSNTFHRSFSYEGYNNQNSFLDHIAERSNGLSTGDFGGSDNDFTDGFDYLENMFWWAYLIDSSGPGQYSGYYDPRFNNMYQRGALTQSGRTGELAFSMAANYSNKVYLGASIQLMQVRYEERMEFQETDDPRTTWNFNNYFLERELETRGSGANVTLGAVVLPTPNLRAGISIQTPMRLNLTDTYQDRLRTVMDAGEVYNYQTKEGNFEYQLTTPMRTTLSATYFAGKKGFVAADMELLSYQNMRLQSNTPGFGTYYSTQNNRIRNKYEQAVNFRLGGEYAEDNFRYRGGYALNGSPFKDNPGYSNHQWSVGFGIREKKTGFDIAFVQQRMNDVYFPYQLNDGSAPAVNNKLIINQIVLGISSKF